MHDENTAQLIHEHLSYELEMFCQSYILLRKNANNIVLKNIFLECFLLHARNLLEFYYFDKKGNYFRAKDCVDEFGVQQPENFAHIYGDINIHLAHLTKSRITKPKKGWVVNEVLQLIKVPAQNFIKKLPKGRYPKIEKFTNEIHKLQFMNLEQIAAKLESLEETIISRLIDRAQFAENVVIYQQGKHGFPESTANSLFELRMRDQQRLEAKYGRFSVPEQRPFITDLPKAERQFPYPDTNLHISDYNLVNLNDQLASEYLKLVPKICIQVDDGHHGSAVEADIYALMAISERVHFGAFYVAEAKYLESPDFYQALIDKNDSEGILVALTRPEVEEKILHRVAMKVAQIQALANPTLRKLIPPELILEFYREVIIPLTKAGELAYFQKRNLQQSESVE